jgi:hypothetical protein
MHKRIVWPLNPTPSLTARVFAAAIAQYRAVRELRDQFGMQRRFFAQAQRVARADAGHFPTIRAGGQPVRIVWATFIGGAFLAKSDRQRIFG